MATPSDKPAIINPMLMTAKVMHKRFFPRVNAFTYGVFYLCLPLAKIAGMKSSFLLGINRAGFFSFQTRDHGDRSGGDLESWARTFLKQAGIDSLVDTITLITFPRVLGYVFNPVSFWLCEDTQKKLVAVLCEVNNTFGQTHTYLCAKPDGTPITPEDWLVGDKVFHVSPFLKREGTYKFRFAFEGEQKAVFIDFYDGAGKKQLITSVIGRLNPLNDKTLFRMVWRYPLVTAKAIVLIHWQALRLISKGIRYIPKPIQTLPRISLVRKNLKEDF